MYNQLVEGLANTPRAIIEDRQIDGQEAYRQAHASGLSSTYGTISTKYRGHVLGSKGPNFLVLVLLKPCTWQIHISPGASKVTIIPMTCVESTSTTPGI